MYTHVEFMNHFKAFLKAMYVKVGIFNFNCTDFMSAFSLYINSSDLSLHLDCKFIPRN